MYMQIRHLLFDMDNTLYPASSAMDRGISERMSRFVADFIGVSLEEGSRLRRAGLESCGTTLGWLCRDYGLTDTEAFFAAVHPASEIAELDFDPELRPFLESLDMPMTVLTNAPYVHAERVLRFFNILDLFTGVHTIESNSLCGKPYAQAYYTAVRSAGYTIEDTAFFDDHLKYIDGYVQLGGVGVWVRPDSGSEIPEHAKAYPHLPSIYQIPQVLGPHLVKNNIKRS